MQEILERAEVNSLKGNLSGILSVLIEMKRSTNQDLRPLIVEVLDEYNTFDIDIEKIKERLKKQKIKNIKKINGLINGLKENIVKIGIMFANWLTTLEASQEQINYILKETKDKLAGAISAYENLTENSAVKSLRAKLELI